VVCSTAAKLGTIIVRKTRPAPPELQWNACCVSNGKTESKAVIYDPQTMIAQRAEKAATLQEGENGWPFARCVVWGGIRQRLRGAKIVGKFLISMSLFRIIRSLSIGLNGIDRSRNHSRYQLLRIERREPERLLSGKCLAGSRTSYFQA
jgi:hypothetical protein